MRLERSVRFGITGTIGVMIISLGTFWVLQLSESPAMPAGQAFIILIIVGFGLAVALMFLFGLMDIFVDEKLEHRERPNTDE